MLKLTVNKKTLVVLGDSITSGWPYEKEYSWVEYLKINSPKMNIYNAGISGDTFGDMLGRLEQDVLKYKPDYCIIMGGTNEAYQHIPQPVLKENFQKVVEKLAAINCQIIIGLPLPVDDRAMEAYLQDIRKWFADYCFNYKCKIIDFYSVMLNENKTGLNAKLFLDGCHPNKQGYLVMGQFAVYYLKELNLI